jgi:hypothetical protein
MLQTKVDCASFWGCGGREKTANCLLLYVEFFFNGNNYIIFQWDSDIKRIGIVAVGYERKLSFW